MRIRPRLLIGSLATVVVLLVAFTIYTASSSGDDGASRADDEVTLNPSTPFDQAPIGTNAKVTGKTLPDTYVRTEEGAELPVSSFVGQPLVINYWSSSCIPCKKELPDFVTAHDELGDAVHFVGINAGPSTATEVAFAADRGVDYDLYYDGDGRFKTAVGISSQPVTLFVRADGTIMKQTGQIDLDTIRASAQELLQ